MKASIRPTTPHRGRDAWGYGLVVLATLAAYLPALGCGFVWDDDGHVTRPELRSLHGLWRIWTEPGAAQQYYPVLHTAFWVEYHLWGGRPWAYHALNVGLHALAACLFARGLIALSRGAGSALPRGTPWLAALLFALHPVGVESVAWISEQKNTLSTVFALLAALAFLHFEGGGAGRRRAEGAGRAGLCVYAGATLLFLLALGSKSVTATLPAALVVCLWWRDGRVAVGRTALALGPWMAAGVLAGACTAWIERTTIGARGAPFALGFAERLVLAGRITAFYAGKLLWPHPLIFIYPRWSAAVTGVGQILPLAGLLACLAAAAALRRRTRSPLAVLLLYVGLLTPALGFVNVYPFVFSYVADHFQYLASLAAFAGLAGGAMAIARALADRAGGVGRVPEAAAAGSARAGGRGGSGAAFRFGWFAWNGLLVGLLVALGVLTWRQCAAYRGYETLFRSVLAGNPDCWMAHDNLGTFLGASGRLDEALAEHREAVRLNPDSAQIRNNAGNALARLGRFQEAADSFAQALRLDPAMAEAELDWGNALADSGEVPEAEGHYLRALELRPTYAEAHYRLGNALGNAGLVGEALGHYESALGLRPDYPEALANAALALLRLGRPQEALCRVDAALRLRPAYAEAHAYRGAVLAALGRTGEAEAAYGEALRLNPRDADVRYQLDQLELTGASR